MWRDNVSVFHNKVTLKWSAIDSHVFECENSMHFTPTLTLLPKLLFCLLYLSVVAKFFINLCIIEEIQSCRLNKPAIIVSNDWFFLSVKICYRMDIDNSNFKKVVKKLLKKSSAVEYLAFNHACMSRWAFPLACHWSAPLFFCWNYSC